MCSTKARLASAKIVNRVASSRVASRHVTPRFGAIRSNVAVGTAIIVPHVRFNAAIGHFG